MPLAKRDCRACEDRSLCVVQKCFALRVETKKSMASTNASNWQQREEEAVKKLRESLPQWTGSLDDDAPLPRGTKTQTGVLPESGLTYYWRLSLIHI